jgi:thioredoxin-dependent peroxiredoxin
MRVLPKMAAWISLAVALATPVTAAVGLKVGDVAPSFSLRGSDGKQYTLADHKGKQAVVLAWFAKAFSPA